MTEDKPAIEARRAYSGPTFLREGFRPFFLGAGVWAVVAVAIWLGALSGRLRVPSAFDPITWHGHEMLFGYATAAVAGFLLTAIPNWTGRLPVRGWPLAGLFALWALGRLAVGLAVFAGPAAAVLDSAFLLAFCVVVWREILAGANWRNLPLAGVVALLAASNVLVHLEALGLAQLGGLGLRLGIAVLACLVALVGGRIVPSFTRNWLAKRGEARLPRPFGRLDRIALVTVLAAAVAWTATPAATVTGFLALLAALANGLRLGGWRAEKTAGEPLVWVLHLGYGWLVVGFGLIGVSVLTPALPQSAALHALTAGAVGTMTLAVMTRATLGHTGRALTAGPATAAAYVLVGVSAVARILSAVLPQGGDLLLGLSGLAWIAAFGLFVALYGPLLVRPRRA